MPANQAAWLISPKAPTLEVKEAPYPKPGSTDLILRVEYVAINPLEYKIQDDNPKIGGKAMPYPTILGADAAGEIVAVGDGVSKWKTGQRIVANVSGLGKEAAAFQLFSRVPEHCATPIPHGMKLEEAVVLPLACDTASAGLFVPGTLALSTNGFEDSSTSTREVILIWGGSSSVGCCAIQLAHAARYEVFATASKRNHELCTSVGASRVFDYTSADAEEEIILAMQGKTTIGALDCISSEKTIISCVQIMAKAKGQQKVMTVLTPPEMSLNNAVTVQRLSIPAYLGTDAYKQVHDFLAAGLADGRLQPKPNPSVVGEGLHSIQQGIDAVRKGQSATKIVVRL